MKQIKTISYFENINPEKLLKNLDFIFYRPYVEIMAGLKTNRLPVSFCLLATSIFLIAMAFNLDYLILGKLNLDYLYPRGFLWRPYQFLVILMPFYLWGLMQTTLRVRLVKKLTQVFTEAGLRSVMNRLPSFISDRPVDEYSRKLLIKLNGQTPKQIKAVKENLETALKVHIDEVKAIKNSGTVEIFYSYNELKSDFSIKDFKELQEREFIIGMGRAGVIKADLANVPHLLVAGQTGMGKSTFLRQFITSLYLRNQKYTFELIDLKQGLEFQFFKDLPRVKVSSNVMEAIKVLKKLSTTAIEQRSKLLLENKCKDIDSFLSIPKKDRVFPNGVSSKINLDRHIVVVDEAFDLFMAGAYADSKDIKESRKAASKIAAQGRAVGVHIVIATQRPDKQAVDPQTKANLTGKVCFSVSNIATSTTILDSKIAADLPEIKGRAIWKSSSRGEQIQTPLLTEDQANELLSESRIKKEAFDASKDV